MERIDDKEIEYLIPPMVKFELPVESLISDDLEEMGEVDGEV